MSSWHQLSSAALSIGGDLESKLLLLDLEALIILRPSQENTSPTDETFMKKFVRNYLDIFRVMLPKSTDVMRTDQLARAAVQAGLSLPDGAMF